MNSKAHPLVQVGCLYGVRSANQLSRKHKDGARTIDLDRVRSTVLESCAAGFSASSQHHYHVRCRGFGGSFVRIENGCIRSLPAQCAEIAKGEHIGEVNIAYELHDAAGSRGPASDWMKFSNVSDERILYIVICIFFSCLCGYEFTADDAEDEPIQGRTAATARYCNVL